MAGAAQRLSLLQRQVSVVHGLRKSLLRSLTLLSVSRDVGVKAIENLMKKKGKFDYILLETTGLADPGLCCFA